MAAPAILLLSKEKGWHDFHVPGLDVQPEKLFALASGVGTTNGFMTNDYIHMQNSDGRTTHLKFNLSKLMNPEQ